MATAEEILAGMAAEETQQVLVIDNDLRTIAIPEGVTLLGVTSDDDVRRLRFAMPRMCGEFDLSAFALRINYLNAGSEGDVYPVADAETDGDTIRFSWLVGRHACKYKGDVRFIVCAKLLGGDGEAVQEYNTTLASLPVLEGLETGEAIVQAHPDVIESILERLDTCTTPPVMSVNGQTGAVALGAGDVGARPDTWTPTAADVGADAAGTALARVGAHNTSGEAHADMRALIDAVTTGKVSTSDIVDNLTTNASGKVLSAAQGVALKALIDAIVIPDKLPNPQPLTINGQRYDGSAAVDVSVTGEGGGANIDDTMPSATTTYSSQKIESELDALNSEMVTQPEGEEAPGTAPEINAGTFGGMTVAQFVDMIYPVGSIYMSARSTSPATLFGGTWKQIMGRFLVGTGAPELNDDGTSPGDYSYAAGAKGGEATNTLTVSEMPSHNHAYSGSGDNTDYTWAAPNLRLRYIYTEENPYPGILTSSYEGGGQPHNNLPPYLAVYMWQRTA